MSDPPPRFIGIYYRAREDHPHEHHDLDSNAFSLIAAARTAFRKAGRGGEWDAVYARLTAGTYDQLLAVLAETCEVICEAPPARCEECDEAALDEHGLCAACGHQHREEECVLCGDTFPAGSLNGNRYCADCEWDEEWAERDAENDDDDDE